MWKALPWLAKSIFNFFEGVKSTLPWLAGGIKYCLRGCGKLCPGWMRAFLLIFYEGVKSTSALAGWRNKILFEKLKQEFVTSQLLRNSDVIIAMLKKEQKILCKKKKRERDGM